MAHAACEREMMSVLDPTYGVGECKSEEQAWDEILVLGSPFYLLDEGNVKRLFLWDSIAFHFDQTSERLLAAHDFVF